MSTNKNVQKINHFTWKFLSNRRVLVILVNAIVAQYVGTILRKGMEINQTKTTLLFFSLFIL